MDRYVGLDAHARSCTLGVIGPSGKRLKSMVVETNGQALVEAVRSIPGRVHLCLEEGTQSAWLYELLAPHVEEVVVVVPAERKGPKDDLRDAWARAEELRTGAIQTRVYKAPQHLAALRNAVRAYGFAVRDVVRAKNRLKSVFLSRGIEVDAGVYEPKGRSKWLPKLPRPHRDLAEWLGQQLDGLLPLREAAEEWLRTEAKTHSIIRTLSTAPGMGIIRSAQVVAVVAIPDRFRTRRQFWSYSGLSIVTRSSADWVRDRGGRLTRSHVHQTRGLTRKRNALLKSVFKGAATTVIALLPDDPLRIAYERAVQAGVKPNLAKLTLARRIAGTVLSMWKNQEVYDPDRHRLVTDRRAALS
jgi:transposase